jgi:hypothetical protein
MILLLILLLRFFDSLAHCLFFVLSSTPFHHGGFYLPLWLLIASSDLKRIVI